MSRNSNILMAVITGAVGILLVVLHNSINLLNWISIAVGIMLLIPSIYILWSSSSSRGNKNSGATVTSVVTLLLGLAMCIFPGFFAGFFVYVLGVLLIAFGLYHIIDLIQWSKLTSIPGYFYIIPALMMIAGVVILCTSVHNINSVVVLITGIALIASSVNSLLEFAGASGTKEIHQ